MIHDMMPGMMVRMGVVWPLAIVVLVLQPPH
jgi:hypothetical protein